MLESILGSQSKEQVLLFIIARESGYAQQIAEYFECSVTPIKNQLDSLEQGGVLCCEVIGKSKIFSINPRYPFKTELIALVSKVMTYMKDDDRNKLLYSRKRPRRSGKPI